MIKTAWAKVRAEWANLIALVGTMLGSIMAHIDDLATVLGDPNLNQQVHTVISDAKWFGRWMLFVGIVATIARFAKLMESPKT